MWALVPVKALSPAKQRLAGVLTPAERAELATAMLDDLLTLLESVSAISRIHVLTADAAVAETVRARGHQVIAEDVSIDLNRNLDAAAARLASRVDRLLIIHADLPAATRQELTDLLAAHQEGATLVPATVDGGTNAVVVEPPDALPFAFGPQSLMAHEAAASEAGLSWRLFKRPGLGRDMDRPDDLVWLMHQSGKSHADALLASPGMVARLTAAVRDSA